jgi:hypothetical protein
VLQQTDIHSFLGLAVPIAGDTHPWLMVLLDAVQDVAFRAATQMKDHFRMPRPDAMIGDLAPVVRTPSHSAFPSGHATEAFAAASVLGALFPDRAPLLRQMATRIAVNRAYAGVHFPVDHHAGAMLGDLLANEILRRLFGLGPAIAAAAEIEFVALNSPPAAGHGVSVEDYANGTSIMPKVPPAIADPLLAGQTGILPWLSAKVWDEVYGRAAP